jgi:hypothetical protein
MATHEKVERSETSQTPTDKDNWIQRHWRPIAAVVYLATVVFDYVIRPLINTYQGRDINTAQILLEIQKIDPSVQIKALEVAQQAGQLAPILPEYYHLSMGAIIGAAAWTRGKEKMERIRVGRGGGSQGSIGPGPNNG